MKLPANHVSTKLVFLVYKYQKKKLEPGIQAGISEGRRSDF